MQKKNVTGATSVRPTALTTTSTTVPGVTAAAPSATTTPAIIPRSLRCSLPPPGPATLHNNTRAPPILSHAFATASYPTGPLTLTEAPNMHYGARDNIRNVILATQTLPAETDTPEVAFTLLRPRRQAPIKNTPPVFWDARALCARNQTAFSSVAPKGNSTAPSHASVQCPASSEWLLFPAPCESATDWALTLR